MSDKIIKTLTVGQIGVTLRESPATAKISCGRQGVRPTIIGEIETAAGQRFFDELTKIRECLCAAHAVLVERVQAGGGTVTPTPAEAHLARTLTDLEIADDWQGTLLERTAHEETP